MGADFFSFWHHKSFWVASSLALFSGLTLAFVSYLAADFVTSNFGADTGISASLVASHSLNSAIVIYGLIAVSIWLVSDFQHRRIQNTLCIGYSRSKYFISKFTISSLFLVFLQVISFCTAYALALILLPTPKILPDTNIISNATLFASLALSLWEQLALGALFAAVAFLTRNVAISLISSICVVTLLPLMAKVFNFVMSSVYEITFNFNQVLATHYIATVPADVEHYVLYGLGVGAAFLLIPTLIAFWHFKLSDV